jgi:hypothetical protein
MAQQLKYSGKVSTFWMLWKSSKNAWDAVTESNLREFGRNSALNLFRIFKALNIL